MSVQDGLPTDPDPISGLGRRRFNIYKILKPGCNICVSLSGSSDTAILKTLKDSAPYADLAEIRLDTISDTKDSNISGLIGKSPLPLIFTNRPVWEGGKFSGNEEDRIRPLIDAIRAGVDFIDIELKTRPDIRSLIVNEAQIHGSGVIVSFHDFSGTPDTDFLLEILWAIYETGADIAKIVTMARSEDDARRVLSLYFKRQETDLPLIAFAMGPHGRASRLICFFLGACLTFASPLSGAETAPGQIPINELRGMVEYLRHV